jgi:hypothetical protein
MRRSGTEEATIAASFKVGAWRQSQTDPSAEEDANRSTLKVDVRLDQDAGMSSR